jgi:4-amino-4-deoxy-L-arabinose transferase-like glycosyltransferase
MKNTD